ncbi:hypothetical protein Ancab_018869 [Ancistrocladus abbreviatus]
MLCPPLSSFSARIEDCADSAPSLTYCTWSPRVSLNEKCGMDLFINAKAVRLRSHHTKFLLAEEDEESVTQDRNGSSKNARWFVEFVNTVDNIIQLKSCYGKYLTASNQPFLLGMTGHKVLQTLPGKLDASVEWEPIKEGAQVKLKTRYGNFLRANGGVPPWRNSVTHDVPHRTLTQDWFLWDVDIVEILENSHAHQQQGYKKPYASASPLQKPDFSSSDSFSSDASLGSERFQNYSRQESSDSTTYSPPKPDGRLIYYHISDENGEINDAMEEYLFTFKGNNVEELTRKLKEETGLEDIVLCSRSPLNSKLYPLRLRLPPNNATMHVVVVQASLIDSHTGHC